MTARRGEEMEQKMAKGRAFKAKVALAALAGDRRWPNCHSGLKCAPTRFGDAHAVACGGRITHTYIANNEAFIPDYGERYRQEERISTGFVESAVNYVVAKRFTKRQQMEWRLAFLRIRL